MLLRLLAILSFAAALAACQTTASGSSEDDLDSVRRMYSQIGDPLPSEQQTQRRARGAAAHPLGSERNPVRANMPYGQRAYLDRLRCADGQAPSYHRAGSSGSGPYGSIVDMYVVQCGDDGEPVVVWMDMYHRHVEQEPVPGFTIVPASS